MSSRIAPRQAVFGGATKAGELKPLQRLPLDWVLAGSGAVGCLCTDWPLQRQTSLQQSLRPSKRVMNL